MKRRSLWLLTLLCAGLLSAGVATSCTTTPSTGDDEPQTEIPLETKISETSLALVVGENKRLTLTDAGDFVHWKSENSAIATVAEDGTVTAVGVGETTVTAQTTNGIVSCTVKVEAALEDKYGIVLNAEELRVYAGESYQLSATVKKGLEVVSGVEITFSSADENLASVTSDGLVTAKEIGETTVRAQATIDGEVVSKACKVYVIYEVEIELKNDSAKFIQGLTEQKLLVSCVKTVGGEKTSVEATELTFTPLQEGMVEIEADGSFSILDSGRVKIEISYGAHLSKIYEIEVYNNLIFTAQDLLNINGTDGEYMLVNDLDFDGVNYVPVQEFGGILDGNGYSIKNVTLDPSDGGLIKTLKGTVRNLAVENITVEANGGVTPNTGTIANVLDGGLIENVYVSGKMYGGANNTKAGLLVGSLANNPTVRNVIVEVEEVNGSASKIGLIAGIGTEPYALHNAFILGNSANFCSNWGGNPTSTGWVGLNFLENIKANVHAQLKNERAWSLENDMPTLVKNVSVDVEELMQDISYTVTVMHGDTAYTTLTVQRGATIDPSQIQLKDGFAGMEIRTKGGKLFDFTEKIMSNTTLNVSFLKLLTTAQEFMSISGTDKYVLKQDIDFTGVAYTPIASFGGVLDGNGYAVKNVTIKLDDENTTGTGLFLSLDGATVKNLEILNATFEGNSSGHCLSSGFVAATAKNTTISDILVTGTIKNGKVVKDEVRGGVAVGTADNVTVANLWGDVSYSESGYGWAIVVGHGTYTRGNVFGIKDTDETTGQVPYCWGSSATVETAIPNTAAGVNTVENYLARFIAQHKEYGQAPNWDFTGEYPSITDECSFDTTALQEK